MSMPGAAIKIHAPLPVRHLTGTLPLVTPLHVFAARRDSFECIVRKNFSSYDTVISTIFEALPLEESGWHPALTRIAHIGNSEGRYPIWRVEKT